MTYTVQEGNELSLSAPKYRGTFQTKEDAMIYIAERVDRVRSFATFVIYTGTPRNPGSAISEVIRGRG